MRSFVKTLLAAVVLSLAIGIAVASAQPRTAAVSGTVMSSDGARLPRASP